MWRVRLLLLRRCLHAANASLCARLHPRAWFAATCLACLMLTTSSSPPPLSPCLPGYHLHRYGQPVDWWSLGIILFECLHGEPPFVGNTVQEIFQKTVHEPITVRARSKKGPAEGIGSWRFGGLRFCGGRRT